MEKLSYSIPEWCEARGISRSSFYNLIQNGLGPKTYFVGRRRFISRDADIEWQRRLETECAGDLDCAA